MEHEQDRKKAAAEAKRNKLENLERKITAASADSEAHAGKKHRFDDTEYLEESRELVDNVRSAVTAGKLAFSFVASMLSIVIIRPSQEKEESQDEPSLGFARGFEQHCRYHTRSIYESTRGKASRGNSVTYPSCSVCLNQTPSTVLLLCTFKHVAYNT